MNRKNNKRVGERMERTGSKAVFWGSWWLFTGPGSFPSSMFSHNSTSLPSPPLLAGPSGASCQQKEPN